MVRLNHLVGGHYRGGEAQPRKAGEVLIKSLIQTELRPYKVHLNHLMKRSRLALKVEGLARVSKNAGGRPRLASVAFDGRHMGLAL